MKITRIEKINFVKDPDAKIKAYVDVELDGELMVKGLKVISGEKNLFLAFPSRKSVFSCPNCETSNLLSPRTKFCRLCFEPLREYTKNLRGMPKPREVVYSINKSFFKYLEKTVLVEYEKAMAKQKDHLTHRKNPNGLHSALPEANQEVPPIEARTGAVSGEAN